MSTDSDIEFSDFSGGDFSDNEYSDSEYNDNEYNDNEFSDNEYNDNYSDIDDIIDTQETEEINATDIPIPFFVDENIYYFDLRNIDSLSLDVLDIDSEDTLGVKIENKKVYSVINGGKLKTQIMKIEGKSIKDIIDQIVSLLMNPGKYCPACGKEHEIESVQPTICNDEFCNYVSSEMGVFVNLWNIFKNQAEVIDLLWTLFYSSIFGPYSQRTDPYPARFNNDIESLKLVLNDMPPIDEIREEMEIIEDKYPVTMYESQLIEYLNNINENIIYLIKWLFGTMRAVLVYHSEYNDSDDKYNSCKQVFRIIADTPERMLKFNELEEQFGTIEGYHGSDGFNWHNILRHQLRNMSGTCGQLHGDMYGKGIYLSPRRDVAISFARKGIIWDKSKFYGLSIYIGAEIINRKDIKTIRDYCYVIPNENDVQIRYLCLF